MDTSPQPYVEVVPGAPGYDQAFAAAQKRLAILHTGSNPAVKLARTGSSSRATPIPATPTTSTTPPSSPTLCAIRFRAATRSYYMYPFAEHPHWVNTDLEPASRPLDPCGSADWGDAASSRSAEGSTCSAAGVHRAPAEPGGGVLRGSVDRRESPSEHDARRDRAVCDDAHPHRPVASGPGLRFLIAEDGERLRCEPTALVERRHSGSGRRRAGLPRDARGGRLQDDLHQLPRTRGRRERAARAEPGDDDRRARARGRLPRRPLRPQRGGRGFEQSPPDLRHPPLGRPAELDRHHRR